MDLDDVKEVIEKFDNKDYVSSKKTLENLISKKRDEYLSSELGFDVSNSKETQEESE